MTMLCLLCLPAHAQDEMPDTDQPAPATGAHTAKPAPAPADESEPPSEPALPAGTMIDMNTAELQALDKITARVSQIEVRVGETTTFGTLKLTVRACRKAPPEDTPESAAFLEISDQKPGEDAAQIYSGWMLASSPGIAAMDHPVYDIWVLDCKNAAASSDSSAAPRSTP